MDLCYLGISTQLDTKFTEHHYNLSYPSLVMLRLCICCICMQIQAS